MALTRDFRDTVQVRARRDPAFRQALLQEGVICLLAGDMETGKAALRDYIHATIGFAELAAQIHKPSKSLLRMFSSKGNPQARNLLEASVGCVPRTTPQKCTVHPALKTSGQS